MPFFTPSLFASPPPFTSPSPSTVQASRGNRRNVSGDTCAAFKHQVLFPGWSTRDSILTSCKSVAHKLQSATPASDPSTSRNYWGSQQVVDERLDPYSARDYDWTRSSQAQQLSDVLQNESRTEDIVRSRSWAVLSERCIGGTADRWQAEYRAWAAHNS